MKEPSHDYMKEWSTQKQLYSAKKVIMYIYVL